MIAHLQHLGQRVFVIAPPGVFRDNRVMTRLGVANALAIYREYTAVMRDALASSDVPVIGVPSECFDDEGFMRIAFRHDDPLDAHHAGAEFGAMMIERIADWLQTPNRKTGA